MPEPVFYGVYVINYVINNVINLKEFLESLVLVINLKRLLNVIEEWDTTWISCDSLHAWL